MDERRGDAQLVSRELAPDGRDGDPLREDLGRVLVFAVLLPVASVVFAAGRRGLVPVQQARPGRREPNHDP
jgi:hypothetical protein